MPTTQASGELVICTLAMPKDTNANGDIFGGWLVSQMDLGGAILAARVARSRVVTIAIDELVFHKPVHVGDRVSCYAKVLNTGRTSITVELEAWTVHYSQIQELRVTRGLFVYVAVDEQGHSTPLPPQP